MTWWRLLLANLAWRWQEWRDRRALSPLEVIDALDDLWRVR